MDGKNIKEEIFSKLLQAFGALVIIPVIVIISALVKVWAILKLWTWFLVPLGLETIPGVNLYGILLIISIIQGYKSNKTKVPQEKKGLEAFVEALSVFLSQILSILFVVFIGFIVKKFVM